SRRQAPPPPDLEWARTSQNQGGAQVSMLFLSQHDDDAAADGNGDFGDAPFTAQCRLMCPEKERLERERGNDLSAFEIVEAPAGAVAQDQGPRSARRPPARSSAALAVKKFRRGAAGSLVRDPNSVRD